MLEILICIRFCFVLVPFFSAFHILSHAFLPAVETQRDRPVVSGEEQSERVERVGGGDVRHDPSRGDAPAPQVRLLLSLLRLHVVLLILYFC